jgi:DNA-binding GntR family transcriptional regulator
MPGPGDENDGAPVEVILTQSQLGEMASLGRQVVNRELRRMEAKGWLTVSYSRITVLAPDALAVFSQEGIQTV